MIGNFSLYKALKPLAIKLPPVKRLYSEKNLLSDQLALVQHENHILTKALNGQSEMLTNQLSKENQILITQLNHLSTENRRLANTLNNLSNKKQTLAEALAALDNEKKALDSKLISIHSEKQNLIEQITCLNSEKQNLIAQLAFSSSGKQALIEKLTCLSDEKQTLLEKLNCLMNEKQPLNEELNALATENKILIKQIAFATSKNQELTDKVHVLVNEKMLMEEEIRRGKLPFHEIAGTLNWPEILDTFERVNGFSELIYLANLHAKANHLIDNPSICWDLLATKNYDQLLTHGFNNFKRTINHNYFNFLIQKDDIQIKSVEALLPAELLESCRAIVKSAPRDPHFNGDQDSYYYFVLLLWEYTKTIDSQHYMDRLIEPDEGNPLVIYSEGKKISQDLANSLLEYYSMSEVVSFENSHSILEVGGGYGRNAFVILTLNSHIKMTLVDIPPALYIAQRYLSSLFKNHPVFMARHFSSYEEVREEMEAASIVFLLPHQLALIPDNHYDLSINISSFGEMRMDQLHWYFTELNRLTKHHFYTKQWLTSKNPFDGIELQRDDYPYPSTWQAIYSRNCAVQTEFFEALYKVHLNQTS